MFKQTFTVHTYAKNILEKQHTRKKHVEKLTGKKYHQQHEYSSFLSVGPLCIFSTEHGMCLEKSKYYMLSHFR